MSAGECPVEPNYAGPRLEQDEKGVYQITASFIKDMMLWFKDGKNLPKRYVWEIVLGAFAHFEQEESLVDISLEDGVTCDVIGDVHGATLFHFSSVQARSRFKDNTTICFTFSL